ncbi:hypothetical protein K431DRAFT_288968 [Polychaeton citri CBS 116435]|uniref:Homeobox domain-containing protein n=1 Tax=Polychaeton citri CBS 116435 TaxID=1314669 RepID=A0A9P4Q001_9PEZI|nr:hypothetical protein K431DRAFT_288968 [Polychaeton citri CBS 116435]
MSHSAPATHTDYAFLNHSASTLPNNLPPDVHNKPLARQKRKRTSPEDQAILEAAYLRDPKPDTEARRQLSQQVALGEKEVQIWFQNRRQSSRRKSRPLLPHEVAQYQASRTSYPPPSMAPAESLEQTSDTPEDAVNNEDQSVTIQKTPDVIDGSVLKTSDDVAAQQSSPGSQEGPAITQTSQPRAADDVVPSGQPREQPLSEVSQESQHAVDSTPSNVQSMGYFANRRNEALLRSGYDEETYDQQSPPLDSSLKRSLKKSRSIVRLSLTNDGNARVIQSSLSPSPQKPSRGSQQDLVSADGQRPNTFNSRTIQSVPTPKLLQRSASGRSRDSRTWEFWCDKEARMELEEKAEKDGSGSAADAIGLMRSRSGRRVLGSLSSKRNAILERSSSSAKRSKLDRQQVYLQRSSTSGGRLQGRARGHLSDKAKLRHAGSVVSVYIPGNESDKENWSPTGESQTDLQSATNAKEGGGMITKRSAFADKSANSKGRRQLSPRKRAAAAMDDPENDPEVAAFMSTERRSSNATEEDDMDCVQGLLSLSQGNWK